MFLLPTRPCATLRPIDQRQDDLSSPRRLGHQCRQSNRRPIEYKDGEDKDDDFIEKMIRQSQEAATGRLAEERAILETKEEIDRMIVDAGESMTDMAKKIKDLEGQQTQEYLEASVGSMPLRLQAFIPFRVVSPRISSHRFLKLSTALW